MIRAAVCFGLFILWILMQIPTLVLIVPIWRRFGIWQMRVFMSVGARIFGVRYRVYGKISGHRPLLLVSNHISIFEIIAFPAMFGCGFFAKAEIKKWIPMSWFVSGFGNLFVDRRPSHAREAVNMIFRQMRRAKNPFVIFPEGTTNNGSYVLPFKSAMFDFLSGADAVQVQPVAIAYRDKYGKKIPPQVLADEYAYISNAKQTQPPYVKKESSVLQLLWRTLMRGGFVTEVHVLPVFDWHGLDRKEIAERLHKIVSNKFHEVN